MFRQRSAKRSSQSPVAITKYLLPREVPVATVRRHPAVLIGASSAALAGLLVAVVLSATYVHGVLEDIMWIAWGLLFLRLLSKVVNWSVTYFVVTSERILLVTGFFTRRVNMLPLNKVTEMSFRRTFAGRLLGYGQFLVESAGPDQALRNVNFIPYPEQLYLLICGMLFPTSAEDEDDESQPSGALADEL